MKRLFKIALCLSLVAVLGGCSPKVPDVSGMTLARATQTIEDAGLKRGALSYDSGSQLPSGTVVSQEPEAGASLPSGSSVLLKLSGVEPAVAPALAGLNATEVADALGAAGLRAEITESYNATIPAGTVISQSVAPGSNTESGSGVKVIISKGPAPVGVPSVVGMTEEEASATLSAAGFKMKATEASSAATEGTIFAQSPVANGSAAKGSTVAVSVSLGGGGSQYNLRGTWKSKGGSTYEFRAGSRVQVPGGGVVRYRATVDGLQFFHPGNTVFATLTWVTADRLTLALWSGSKKGPTITYNRVN